VATIAAPALANVSAVRSLDLDNIYFVPDSAVIASQSLPLIRNLAQTLQNYQDERFEIIGHANCQETLDPSKIKNFYRLSEQRAKLIYQLLLEHGIPAEKMSYKGIANTQPAIDAPQSVAEKKMNMRVQILITKVNWRPLLALVSDSEHLEVWVFKCSSVWKFENKNVRGFTGEGARYRLQQKGIPGTSAPTTLQTRELSNISCQHQCFLFEGGLNKPCQLQTAAFSI